jgi:LPXTG-site transpeptidase (sortase) family protein
MIRYAHHDAGRRAGGFEKLAWTCGGALLCLHLGVRIALEHDRKSAVAAFDDVKAERRVADPSDTEPAPGIARPEAVHGVAPAAAASLSFDGADAARWPAPRLTALAVAAHGASPPRAVLVIEGADREIPVYAELTESNLNRGAAWISGTAPIGAPGNTGLAAHRDRHFRALQYVSVGDELALRTRARVLRYRITELRIVSPQAVDVLADAPRDVLTLVTCYPFYYVGPAPQRFIVRAERI